MYLQEKLTQYIVKCLAYKRQVSLILIIKYKSIMKLYC